MSHYMLLAINRRAVTTKIEIKRNTCVQSQSFSRKRCEFGPAVIFHLREKKMSPKRCSLNFEQSDRPDHPFSLDSDVGDAMHRCRFPIMRRRDDLVALPTTS